MFLDLLLYIDIYNFCLLVGFVFGWIFGRNFTHKRKIFYVYLPWKSSRPLKEYSLQIVDVIKPFTKTMSWPDSGKILPFRKRKATWTFVQGIIFFFPKLDSWLFGGFQFPRWWKLEKSPCVFQGHKKIPSAKRSHSDGWNLPIFINGRYVQMVEFPLQC